MAASVAFYMRINCESVALLSLLLLLLLRQSVKGSIVQEERRTTAPCLVTGPGLPHAIVLRLHVRKNSIVIHTPETSSPEGV